jgi:hypothetical protein
LGKTEKKGKKKKDLKFQILENPADKPVGFRLKKLTLSPLVNQIRNPKAGW